MQGQPQGGDGSYPRLTTNPSPVGSGLQPSPVGLLSQVLMWPPPSCLQTSLPLVNPRGPPLPDPAVFGLLLPTSLQHTTSLQGVPSSSCACLIVSRLAWAQAVCLHLGWLSFCFLSCHFCRLRALPNCHLPCWLSGFSSLDLLSLFF